MTLERLAIPFINPNNLASFAGIGILCGLGVLIGEIEGLWRSDTPTREKLRRFIEVVVVPRWYVVFSILMLVIAAAATLSRAGLAAIILGLLTLLFCLGRGNSKVLGWASGVLVLIVMGGALIYGETATRWVDRLEWTGAGATNRMQIYENTLEAMAASPWLGYGYGSFPALYRVYNQHDVTTVVEKAHSTILEVLVELGVPAAVMLFTAIVWPIMWCFRGARFRQKNRYIPAIAAAVSVLLIAHSTVDFPLQITAITAAFAMILGIGTAQSWSTRKREVKPEG